MPFLTQTKTNWKFIAIVAVLAVIVGAGIWGYLQTIEVVEGPVVEELPVEKPVINPVAEYFEGAELQYEGEDQKENIVTSLNDILSLSEEELQQRRYKDYEGKENQWDLPTLIYRHFVPAWPGVTLGDDFFHDVKLEEAQKQVEQILIEITEESSVEESEEEKYIKILSPSGGEVWETGGSYEIKWQAEGVDRVLINIISYSSNYPHGIASSIARDIDASRGSYRWNIPKNFFQKWSHEPGENFEIRIVKTTGGSPAARSNSNFSILEKFSLTLLYPNGGERLMAGDNVIISWDAKNIEKIDIKLVENKDFTMRERLIVKDLILAGKNQYQWIIPEDILPSKYFLHILSDGGLEDFSDDYFIISNFLSVQEKEEMLRQMLKGNYSIAGNEIIPFDPSSHFHSSYLNPYLNKIIEGSFSEPNAKEYLFILHSPLWKGIAIVLGFFNENKKLISATVEIDHLADSVYPYDFPCVQGQLADIKFYSCRGMKYILGVSGGCPTGGWCSLFGTLYKLENGEFRTIQNFSETISEMRDYWMDTYLILEYDRVLFYEWTVVDYDFKCLAPDCLEEEIGGMGAGDRNGYRTVLIYFGELIWDKDYCKFIEKSE